MQVGSPTGVAPFKSGSERKAELPKFSGVEQWAQSAANTAKAQAAMRMGKFSGIRNRFYNMMLPPFQKISEVYIASFLALDAIGFYVPRIGNAAATGREKFDPSKDPATRDLPFREQVKLWITGNIRGLNWGNLREETFREFATGPGLLIIPSILYVYASRTLGRTGIHLRHQALNELCDGFSRHLQNTPLQKISAGDLNLADYRREMGNYINSIFRDTAMRETVMPDGKGTYGAFLDDWSQRWAKAMELKGDKAARKKQETALAQLSAELQEKLVTFNKTHRLKSYTMNGKTIGAHTTDSLLHRVDHVWAAYGANAEPKQVPLGQVLQDLSKWTDVAGGIFRTQTEKLAGMTDVKLPEVVEFVRRKVMAHKTLFGLSATLLGTAYLFKLVFWTQRLKSYPATRLLHDQPPGGHEASPPNNAANGAWRVQA
jgi:hypothetical protein